MRLIRLRIISFQFTMLVKQATLEFYDESLQASLFAAMGNRRP